MLKKNQPVKFKREGSVMETVYNLVRDGADSKQMVIVKSKLKPNQVAAALTNLCFTGMIESDLNNPAGIRYYLPNAKPKPAPALTPNSICSPKSKGGRPKKQDKQNPISFRPQSKELRDVFYRMGGSRWINRILAGLAGKVY
jgi:hypothetical protein